MSNFDDIVAEGAHKLSDAEVQDGLAQTSELIDAEIEKARERIFAALDKNEPLTIEQLRQLGFSDSAFPGGKPWQTVAVREILGSAKIAAYNGLVQTYRRLRRLGVKRKDILAYVEKIAAREPAE